MGTNGDTPAEETKPGTTKDVALRVEGKVDSLLIQVATLITQRVEDVRRIDDHESRVRSLEAKSISLFEQAKGLNRLEDHERRIRLVENQGTALVATEKKKWSMKERAAALVLTGVAVSTFFVNFVAGGSNAP